LENPMFIARALKNGQQGWENGGKHGSKVSNFAKNLVGDVSGMTARCLSRETGKDRLGKRAARKSEKNPRSFRE
jgi:hypothetical protein